MTREDPRARGPAPSQRRRAGALRRGVGGALDLSIASAIGVTLAGRWETLTDWLHAHPYDLFEALAITLHVDALGLLVEVLAVCFLPLLALHVVTALLEAESPGAWALRMERLNRRGQPAGRGRRLAHALAYLLWPLTAGLAALWVALSPTGRGLHDVVAGVWVVRR